MAADPDLIALFARGWAITRGVAPPVAVPGGHYIAVGQPDQKARYVFPHLDRAALAALAETIREPWVYLKVCAEPEAVRAILSDHWTIRQEPTYIMTVPTLANMRAPLPAGFRLLIEPEDAVLKAGIVTDGIEVARGYIAILDETALFDQVRTDDAYQRRGLGRAVMQGLSDAARARGATSGLLSATEMGRQLYESIGWTVASPYTSAVIPG